MTGSPEHVGRDSWWFGTAYSAPSYMLAAQAYAVVRLAAGPHDRARAMLRLLGTSMIGGYLSERFDRAGAHGPGGRPVETPIVAVGFAGTHRDGHRGRRPSGGALSLRPAGSPARPPRRRSSQSAGPGRR